MGWLVACFGVAKKRKRLKSSHRIRSQDKGIGSYQALELPSSHSPDGSERGKPKPICSNLKRRKQDKARTRKKVRFDLNVIAYEPIPAYGDDDGDNDDDLRSILGAKWGEHDEQEVEVEEDILDLLVRRGNSTGLKRERSDTSDYRYNNCYDEEEEMESDIDDDDDDLDLEDEEDDDDKELTHETDEDQAREELETVHESLESDPSRSRCVNPVLIPIENLNQWRAIKMKKWEIVA